MYAIIDDSGRQFRVKKDMTFEVDIRDLPEGSKTIEFDRVLLIGDEAGEASPTVGQPWVPGATVVARINGERKGDKIDVIKAKRRKGYRLKQGHRQRHLNVTVESINA